MKNLLLIFLFLANVSLFAQDIIIDIDDDGNVSVFNERNDLRPLIEVVYSSSNLKQKDFVPSDDIATNGAAQLRLGYAVVTDSKIKKMYEDYIFIGFSSPSMAIGGSGSSHSFEIWKGGSISRISYALPLSNNVDFIPYYAGGLFLYSMSYTYEGAVPMYYTENRPNETIINRSADKKIHFGNTYESGMKIKFNNSFSVFGGYSAYVYYPRFMTWKFFGSILTYQIGLTLLDNFNRRIINNSTVAGVLIDVILKSAYNYMFYHFQKGDMNWPVVTETPFTQEGISAGISFNF